MTSFDTSLIANPEVFAIHRLKAHSDHKYYKDAAGKEEFRILLNGDWSFHYAERIEDAPRGFSRREYDISAWNTIPVPSHLELQGYGNPQYSNIAYPWDGVENIIPGQVPVTFNPTGTYVRDIPFDQCLPYISFQGVESAFSLWVNGNFVGYSEDSFTPSEFYIGEYLEEGMNRIGVQVYRFSSGSWLEDQDFFRFSGIFRDVYFFDKPSLHLQDLFVRTSLSGDQDKAAIRIHLDYTFEEGAGAKDKKATYLLMDADGLEECLFDKSIAGRSREIEFVDKDQFEKPDSYTDEVEIILKNPRLWSAEKPYLYTLRIALYLDGELVETVFQKIGVRYLNIDKGILRINGARLVFNGVNRHEFCLESGRVVPQQVQKEDVINMKRSNINAVRTSHYPNSTCFYDLADAYGLYLIDETNLETHGSVYRPEGLIYDEKAVPGDRPEWLYALLDRANSMFERDKNHPSVLLWSCGNESAGGKNIYLESQLLRLRDDTRYIHYEGLANDNSYPDTSDVVSRMYWKVPDIEAYIKEHPEKPFISCEYSHSMGNSTGNLSEYTDLAKNNPLYQGGFIWDYVDQALPSIDPNGNPFMGYGGDFADRPHDADFSADGIMFADRKPSPKLSQVKHDYQGFEITVQNDRTTIRNHMLFTDSDDFEAVAILTKNGEIVREDKLFTNVSPGAEATYLLPYDANKLSADGGEYIVTVSLRLRESTAYAQAGFEIAFGQSEGYGDYKEGLSLIREIKGPVSLEDSVYNTGVHGQDFHYIFRKGPVSLYSMKKLGKKGKEFSDSAELLFFPMRPSFFRAPVQNDTGSGMLMRQGLWKLVSQTAMATQTSARMEGDKSIIEYAYHNPYFMGGQKELCHIVYEVHPHGLLKVTMESEDLSSMPELPEYGVSFALPLSYDQLSWYGRGPEETYLDRKSGNRIGIYHNLVEDNIAPYVMPQETGNHADVRYAQITNGKGESLRIYADDQPLNVSVLPYTPDEMDQARHYYELPRPYQTFVRISSVQMGVGGDDSWGAPIHDAYRIPLEGKKRVSFYLSIS